MRVLFYSGGTRGSGHVVLGLSIAAALKRAALPCEFLVLCPAGPFLSLAARMGVEAKALPEEGADALSPARCRDSALYAAIASFDPDILLVDMSWFALDGFAGDLGCRRVFLSRQVDPRFFRFDLPDRRLAFRPADYDLVVRTEPGFGLPFESRSVEPIVIRNLDEIKDAAAARAELGLAEGEKACLFAFNGNSWEGEEAWKSFSYLAEEGWRVIRSGNREGGLFPAADWFNAFDLLVCGAGYSAFWEARAFGKEAFFVPFPRRFEDQERRIALCSDYRPTENGADGLARLMGNL